MARPDRRDDEQLRGIHLNRAYSLLTLKSVDPEARQLTGWASTPAIDSVGDILEPLGAEIKTPLPLLWAHDAKAPIGHVIHANATRDGIFVRAQIAKTDEPGTLRDRLDEAWQSIKIGLVRGLSVGFAPIKAEPIRGGGMRFVQWALRELSAVVCPANTECTITNIKSFDRFRPHRVYSLKTHRSYLK